LRERYRERRREEEREEEREREERERRKREREREVGGIPSTSKRDILLLFSHNSVVDASRSLPLLLLK
jgi:hypothetical protein